jgi:hypothetical protein
MFLFRSSLYSTVKINKVIFLNITRFVMDIPSHDMRIDERMLNVSKHPKTRLALSHVH